MLHLLEQVQEAAADLEFVGAALDQHQVTAAQVALRWLVQKEIVAIPRSTNPERIRQNIDLDGLTLDDEQMARVDALPRQLGN